MKATPKPIEFTANRWDEKEHQARQDINGKDPLTGVKYDYHYPGRWPGDPPAAVVDTPMGRESVADGDWILTTGDGRHQYHYSPDVFELLFNLKP